MPTDDELNFNQIKTIANGIDLHYQQLQIIYCMMIVLFNYNLEQIQEEEQEEHHHNLQQIKYW